MEINVLIEQDFEEYLGADWLQSIAEQALVDQDAVFGLELGLVITGQERVRQLNRSYLGNDEPTDVLSFPMFPEPLDGGEFEVSAPFITPPDGVLHLGEVIVSYPQAVIQAGQHRYSVKREVAVLIIHGVLHLLGYDHDEPEPERRMKAREEEILSGIQGGLD